MAEANGSETAPLTITAREVNRVVIGHQMGAMEWMRLPPDEKEGLIAAVRADAVSQLTKAYPGHLYAFTEPKVEADGTGLTIAGDRTLDKGITLSCPVFVFEPQVQTVPEKMEDRVDPFLSELNAIEVKYGLRLLERDGDFWVSGYPSPGHHFTCTVHYDRHTDQLIR